MIPPIPRLPFTSCLVMAILMSAFVAQPQKLPRDILFEKIPIPGTIRSSQVADIVQDKLGLIWIAGDCLYQYDGYQFREYRELADGKGKLHPNDIHYLFYDSISNRLLLATHKYGIVAYDYKTDLLKALPSVSVPPIIHQIAQTTDGRVWVGSHIGGLYYLDQDTLKACEEINRLHLYPLSLMAVGSKVYMGESSSVYVLENGKVIEQIKLEWPGMDIPSPTRITAVYIDRTENLWMGTESRGVFVYNLPGKKFVKHFGPNQAPFFSRVSRIHQDQEGFIWILTKASGIAIYSPQEDKIVQLRKDPFSKPSISSDNCFSILEDKQGIIWVGATGDLNKYDREQIRFRHIYHNPLNKISLTDNMVRGLQEGEDGTIWVGTDGGYVNFLNLKDESVDHLKIKIGTDSANYVPLYFCEQTNRVMLIGSSLGLLQFDRQTKRFSPYKPLWPLTKGRTVRQILRQRDTLYFISQGMLHIHNLKTKSTQSYIKFGDNTATNVTAIYIDDRERLWLGLNRGISLFDAASSSFQYFPLKDLPLPPDRSLLLVLSMQQVDNKLFVGTFNAGLWEFDISNVSAMPEPKRYREQDGLPSNTVYAAIPDQQGFLWLSTNGGVAKFDPRKNQFIAFSITEGLQEEEYNRLAYLKCSNGEIIFGGINGINIFHPENIKVTPENFTPEILSVSADNPLLSKPCIRTHIPGSEELKLSFDQNFIKVHFFVPHFQEPRRYKILYKLENFEKEWKEALHENIASYTNLPPGHYNFIVKTIDINGQQAIAQLPMIIKPPYWRTWWFILLTICIVAFLIMTIIRSYIRKAQYDTQRLEELLKIRTYEIEKSKEELHILNQKKDLIFSILSHDLRAPLTTLKGFLGYIISHANELSTEELKRHAVNIKNSVSNSLDLIDNTLFWSLSQMGNIQYNPINFSLPGLLEKLRGLYQLMADKKRIALTIACEEDIILHGDENMIYVTLRNLVSNALKFSTEGSPVIIHCIRKEGFAEINVIDSGIGMSQEYLRKVLSMEQPLLKKGTSNEKGTGLGLLLCKKFVEMNKGELRINSVEHVGTTFTVILPLAVHQPIGIEN